MSLLFVSGLGLAVSPWAFGYIAVEAPAFSSKVVAAGLMLVGLAAYVELRDWALRGAVIAALSAFVAPVLLGFEDMAAAALSHGGAGALAALAAVALFRRKRTPPTPAQAGRTA